MVYKPFKSNVVENGWYSSVTEFKDDFKFFCEICNDSLIKDNEKGIVYGVLDTYLSSEDNKVYFICVRYYDKNKSSLVNSFLIEKKDVDRLKYVPRSFITNTKRSKRVEG